MSTSADSADTSDCTVGLNQRGSPVKLLSFSLKTSLDSASKGDSFRNNRWCDNLFDNQERGAKAKVLYTFNSREITENPNAIRLIMAVDFGHVLFRFLDSRSQVEYRVLSNQRHNAATIRCPHEKWATAIHDHTSSEDFSTSKPLTDKMLPHLCLSSMSESSIHFILRRNRIRHETKTLARSTNFATKIQISA